ncbi:MAG: type II secretion system F family protein [Caulobacteraceae bacterium]
MFDPIALFDNPINLLAIFVALGCFATVATLAMPLFRGDKLESRLKSVANRREELRRRSRQQIREGGLRQVDESLAKKVVERFELNKLLEDPKVVDNLAQAGLRGPKPVSTFYFFRLIMPFILAALAALYLFALHTTHLTTQIRMAIVVGLCVAGYYAPNLYIKNRISKRQASIMAVFPDALDLLLICVEAGMSIEAAVQKVAAEIGSSSIELAEELGLMTAELSYLPDRRMAYEGLAKRTGHPGVKAVATAMIQAERYGTPLGGALRVMAKENREMRIAAAEKKAAQLPAKLTVPMILFFLPVLFIVILGPAIMKVQDTQKHDHTGSLRR